jgi:hypothetical protein
MSIREDVAKYLHNNEVLRLNWHLSYAFTDEILALVQKGLEKELTNGSSNNKSETDSREIQNIPS